MKYVEISNLGKISKPAIELLGFSDKRNRTDLIGEKGTGLKFSRLQCLRKAIQVYVTTDSFKSWYSKKKIDDENDQVIFRYTSKQGKSHAKPSSYTVQAGFSDWTDDWFIVREIIQNAVDETKRNGLSDTRNEAMAFVLKCVRIVDKISFAKKGNTNVYIELTPSIEKVFNNINEYFVYDPIFECEHGSLHAKKHEDKIKIYKQGIFVKKYIAYTALYDYECSNLALQENRTPQHGADVSDEVLKIYSEAPIKIKREFLRYCDRNSNTLELNGWDFTSPLTNIEAWVKAFHEEYGDKTVIHYDEVIPEHVNEKIKMHKYRVVVFKNPLFKFFKDRIKTLEELTSSYEELQYHIVEPNESQARKLDNALTLIKTIFNKKVPVKVFNPLTDLEHNTAGVFLPRKGIILLNSNRCSSVEEILPILTEEFIHAETGADDGSRAFQNFAMDKISQLLLK